MSMSTIKKLAFCLFSMSASLALVAGGLPAGYQQIPYIYADNSKNNTYVLTDYTPNPSTDKIVAEVSFPEAPTANLCVWCARRGTSSPVNTFSTFVLKHASDGNKLKFASHYGQQSNDEAFLSVVSKDTVYTVITEANTCKLLAAGEEISSCTHPAAEGFTATGGPLMLFASYNGNTGSRGNYGSFRLHSLQVYRSGAILYDIVPVRDSANTLMLFNKTDESIKITLNGTFTGDSWKTFLERLATSENVISAEDAEGATGGDIIWRIGNDYMHIFTNANEAATFTPTVRDLNARILLVGGGGAGGTGSSSNNAGGGGGGAGGMIDTSDVVLALNTAYSVTVGEGGVPGDVAAVTGGSGGSSSISALEVSALGGGGGGGYGKDGSAGGSGGGGGANGGNIGSPRMAGGAGTPNQGSNGGMGSASWNYQASGGGGGGAGAEGAESSTGTVPGAGGDGRVSNILGYDELFAGGGGGGNGSAATQALGGNGGGGNGGYHTSAVKSCSGEDGQGGGGGGGSGAGNGCTFVAAAGGSGIVIIRYHYSAGGKDVIFVPMVKTGLVYDGNEQQGVYDGEGYTLTGHKATGGGTHTAIATLTDPDNTEWADDGTTEPKSIEWTIAPAANVWTTEAAISKESWIVEGDTPGVLTAPVAKFGKVVATLNDAEWDGATLPTAVGNYTAVWSVAETTDFTGLSVTKTFKILPVPSPEDYVARYWDGSKWTGVNTFEDAVTECPDGGIVEINQDLTFGSNASKITKSLTLRSCTARNERYEMKATGNARLIDVEVNGGTVVVSNLVVNGNGKDANFVYLTKGTLTLGHNLLLQKGNYQNGSLMGAEAGTVVNLDGVSVSNSSGNWGLFSLYNACTVNLYDCDIHGVGSATSNNRGSVLHMSKADSVLNVYGGTITGNVSQADCGQVQCAGAVNFHGGKPLIEELKVMGAESIRLDGTLDAGASVGVMYGAAEGDPFGTYVSGDMMCARAFYPTLSDNPKLRGGTRGTKLVWKTPTGLILIFR